MNITYDLTRYLNNPEVAEKVKIIAFFDTYGLKVTKDAYEVGRSTIYLWKKKIKERKGFPSLSYQPFKQALQYKKNVH